MILSILMSVILAGSSLQTIPDSEGWVSVERPDVQREELLEEEKGNWVVFSKEMDGEKFLISFPDDPSYFYHSEGIQFEASQGEDRLRLQVEKRVGEGRDLCFEDRIEQIKSNPQAILLKAKRSKEGNRLDLFYSMNEIWVWERIISTSKFLYTFHTESSEMSGETHARFTSSLDILSPIRSS